MKVLKFGAVWCPGCLVMKPRWSEIESENAWLETVMYDFDQDKEAVEKYNITDTLPQFVFLDKNDEEFLRLSGEIEKDKLISIIQENKDK
ncbi:MAG: thioredoxin family protein [Candidatus Gastranaerophilales bacterium]|nr:thioredoxin family protein [Candidatus Gastranaerophilales bacterium]